MRAPPGLRRVAILAAFGSLVVVSCGTETIDLLPPEILGEAGASDTGASTGAHGGTMNGAAGASGLGGNAGTAGASGAGGGGTYTCVGVGCGGLNFGGFAGSLFGGDDCDPDHEQCGWCQSDQQCQDGTHCSQLLGGVCVECTEKRHCRDGYACEVGLGRCSKACQDSIDCPEYRVCDTDGGVCVECLGLLCAGEEKPYCAAQRCVECLSDDQCKDGPQRVCANGSCTECYLDKHCGPDRHCNIARGDCEE